VKAAIEVVKGEESLFHSHTLHKFCQECKNFSDIEVQLIPEPQGNYFYVIGKEELPMRKELILQV
jgi:hypothetical protein